MLESLITSKTRTRLLLKFFLNPETSAYLRSLADEFGESTNGVRVELNRLSEAGLLESADEGRTKVYRANTRHPLFPELRKIAAKTLGIDQVVEQVIRRLGSVELAFVTGDYARGIDSGLIDLVIVGEIDRAYFDQLSEKRAYRPEDPGPSPERRGVQKIKGPSRRGRVPPSVGRRRRGSLAAKGREGPLSL